MKLVVGEFLRGLGNADTVSEPQRRLRYLPRSLEEFYERAFDRIDEFYKQDTARILLLVSTARRPLPLATIRFYELGKDAIDPLASDPSLYAQSQKDAAYESYRIRLNSRCQDFIAVKLQTKIGAWTKYTVDFLHGTVAEFLETPRMKARLAASSGEFFSARHCLLRAALAQIKSIPSTGSVLIFDYDQ